MKNKFSHLTFYFSSVQQFFSPMHRSFFLSVIYFSRRSCFLQQFVSDYFFIFWLFGSSRAPFPYLATESPNIPAMGRKAESSYLKSSQVRRNLFFFFAMSVFAIHSFFGFHDGTQMTSLAEKRSSKTFIRDNENRSALGISLTNTAESCSGHMQHITGSLCHFCSTVYCIC